MIVKVITENPRLWLTVYRCDGGGIHFVFQNINVGMTAEEFLVLNRSAQAVAAKMDVQEGFSTSVSLHYKSTTIAIRSDQFKSIALNLEEAASQIECLLELDESPVKTNADGEDAQHGYQSIPHVRLN